jgi:hypothetical protein
MIYCQVPVMQRQMKTAVRWIADGEALTLSVIARQFSDEEAAWLFLERTKWPHGPVCSHRGTVNHAYYLQPKGGENIRQVLNKHAEADTVLVTDIAVYDKPG